jgi:hypothetical protein
MASEIKRIMRERTARPLSGVGRTKWRADYVLHDENDPFVPGTNDTVKRVRPIRLGLRQVIFDGDEVDAQNRALIAYGLTLPLQPPKAKPRKPKPRPVTDEPPPQRRPARRRATGRSSA